jgi:hypothetical protein
MKRLFLPFVLMLGFLFVLPVQAAPPLDAVTAAYLDSHPDSAIVNTLSPAQPAFDALEGTGLESAAYHAGLCQMAQDTANQLARDKAFLLQTGYRRSQADDWVEEYAVTSQLLTRYRRDLTEHCGYSL